MMHMTFYWSIQVTILFDSWKTHSWLGYLLSLLSCFLSSVFYQYMEDRRIRFKALSTAASSAGQPPSGVNAPLLPSKGSKSTAKFATALLFGVNSAIGYMLMLAIMSFNGGVFIAIVVGLSVGYFLFRCGEDEVVVLDNPCACA